MITEEDDGAGQPPEMKFPESDKETRPRFKVSVDPVIDTADIVDSDFNTILPSTFQKDAEEIERKIVSGELISAVDTEKGREWFSVLKAGAVISPSEDINRPTVEDEDAFFEQGVSSPSGLLEPSSGKLKNISNQILSGDKALLRARSHLGLGTTFRTPLWNSGFWMTFRAPSEPDILELQRVIIEDKIILGRSSYGLLHSNITCYVVQRLLDFALSHLENCSLDTEGKDIREFISCHDIPTIVWGIACSIWPQGFKFQRACTTDPEKCQHVITQKLNLGKILWTNTNSLSAWQIAHMSSVAPKSKKTDDVLRYVSENLKSQKREVSINKNLDSEFKVTFRVPSAEEYIMSGINWITGITDVVNKAISSDSSIAEKNNYITRRGKATSLRQYGHWIDKIELSEGNTIVDKETIELILNDFSSEDEIRDQIFKETADYIAKSTLTVIGIPSYDCPNCGGEQNSTVELPNHTNIIPIDVYTTFFTLLVQKLAKIEQR